MTHWLNGYSIIIHRLIRRWLCSKIASGSVFFLVVGSLIASSFAKIHFEAGDYCWCDSDSQWYEELRFSSPVFSAIMVSYVALLGMYSISLFYPNRKNAIMQFLILNRTPAFRTRHHVVLATNSCPAKTKTSHRGQCILSLSRLAPMGKSNRGISCCLWLLIECLILVEGFEADLVVALSALREK